MVGAARSGSGKTTVTLGLVAALRRRGVAVRTAKSGPDYIDPAFHAAASGQPGTNLDSWAMPPALLDALVAPAATAEVLILESAMGLFDGVDAPPGRSGAGADLAARWGLPVLLVLDVSGQAQTAAAIARGFAAHDPAVRIGGVVLNRVASERHRRMAADAIAALGLPVLGAIPRDATLGLPERHLGLVQAAEHPALADHMTRLADMADQYLDLDAILAGPAVHLPTAGIAALPPPPGQRIALAQDAAFTFTYPHILAGWRAAGAEILPFSPLADQPPPDAADAAWLPGGYPELHAAALAAARRYAAGLRQFAATRPVHGECGGYMALGAGLIDAAGEQHAMAGLLDHVTSYATRRLHLGYRQATLPDGATLRGHEFHYASVADAGTDAPYASIRDSAGAALGSAGGRRGSVTGSFFHTIALEQA